MDVSGDVLLVQLDDDATPIRQLAETSDLVRDLAHAPIPDGVTAVSIAARGDLVVPVPRAVLPGGVEVVVPLDGAPERFLGCLD